MGAFGSPLEVAWVHLVKAGAMGGGEGKRGWETPSYGKSTIMSLQIHPKPRKPAF